MRRALVAGKAGLRAQPRFAGYPVPAGEAEVELRFKNSRFIGVAGPAASAAEARAFVESVRRRHPGASHYVYAFAAGYGASLTHGMSDGGEPSGTAGRPALAVVQGVGLGDVAVVIARYFGGTKLGTGGLVKAYTETAQAALAALPRRRKIDALAVRLLVPYECYRACRGLVETFEGIVEGEAFGAQVEVRARIDRGRLEQMRRALQEHTAGRVDLEIISP